MASRRRKPSLADVRGPGDQARIDARGSVRPARERIRPGRFRPSKELLDFRGLSKTLAQVASTATAVHERYSALDQLEQEQATLLAQKNDEMRDDLLAGGPMRFLGEPDPLSHDDPHVATLIGQPGIVPQLVDPMPEQLRETEKVLGDGIRSGHLPADKSPMAARYSGQVLGGLAGAELTKRMEDDLPFMVDGEWTNEGFVTHVDFEQRLGEHFADMLEKNPRLDMKSGERDIPAITQMMREWRDRSKDFKRRVEAGKRQNAQKRHGSLVTQDAHRILEDALDPKTSNRTERADGISIGEDDAAAAEMLSEKYDKAVRDGFPPADLIAQQLRDVVGMARNIDAKYADEPDEREARLEQLLNIFGEVRMGKVKAIDHDAFDESENMIMKMIRSGTKGGSGVGSGDIERHNRAVAKSPSFADAITAIKAENPQGLQAARQSHRTWLDDEIKRLGYTGSKADDFQRAGMVMWEKQGALAGFSNTRQAMSVFALNTAVNLHASGKKEDASVFVTWARAEGLLQGTEAQRVDDLLGEMDNNREEILTHPSYAFLNGKLTAALGDLKSLGDPELARREREAIQEGQAALFIQANRIFNEAVAAGKSGVEAIGMASRTGGELRSLSDELVMSSRALIQPREDALKELDKRKQTGPDITPGEKARFRAEIGEGADQRMELVSARFTDGGLWNINTQTGQRWRDYNNVDIPNAIRTYMRQVQSAAEPKDRFANLQSKAKELFNQLGRDSNRVMRGTRAENWDEKLMEKWEESFSTLKESFKGFEESDEKDVQRAADDNKADNALKQMGKGKPINRSEFVSAAGMHGLHSLSDSAKTYVDGPAWTGAMAFRALGPEKTGIVSRLVGFGPAGRSVHDQNMWNASFTRNLQQMHEDHTAGTVSPQTVFEVLAMTGRISIVDLASDATEIEYTDFVPVSTDTAAVAKFAALMMTGKLPDSARKEVTFRIPKDQIQVPRNLGPWFASKLEMEHTLKDSERFAKVSEVLGFGKWDIKKDPRDDPRVKDWAQRQEWMRLHVPRRPLPRATIAPLKK